MITIIFGAPGTGKSSKEAHFIKQLYHEQGRAILAESRKRIEEINARCGCSLSVPERVPIFSDFPVVIKSGYEKYYETYRVNGFYLGLPNDQQEVMFVPPGSKIFLSEAQRYYDSRKSKTLPGWVSRFYEMHRHYGLDIWMDVQRPNLIDLNIKELCQHFIEIVKLEHEYDALGRIVKSRWCCREFDSWNKTERYLNGGEKTYEETEYVNVGDVFKLYDSHTYFDKFLPTESRDFCVSAKEFERYKDLYEMPGEPETYRSVSDGRRRKDK